jgi:hypothetical protein
MLKNIRVSFNHILSYFILPNKKDIAIKLNVPDINPILSRIRLLFDVANLI